MPFKMKHLLILMGLTCFLSSCNWDTTGTSGEKPEAKLDEKVKMLYYNPDFKFDTTSKLRLDGFYQIREMFGTYTTNGKDYYPNNPTYGYIQLFKDGFCKVGWWNGFFQSPTEIQEQIAKNKAFGFWGIYKTLKDTLLIEYLYNPVSPGREYSERRNFLSALIDINEIIVTTHDRVKYSYPDLKKDSLTSSCVGKFVKMTTSYVDSDNYLKKEIGNYR